MSLSTRLSWCDRQAGSIIHIPISYARETNNGHQSSGTEVTTGTVSGPWGRRQGPGAGRILREHSKPSSHRAAALSGSKHSGTGTPVRCQLEGKLLGHAAVCSVLFTSSSPEPRARAGSGQTAQHGRTDRLTLRRRLWMLCVCRA